MREPVLIADQTIAEPLVLADVKSHLRIDDSLAVFDADLTRFIAEARSAFERVSGRRLITTKYRWTVDRFPRADHRGGRLRLPLPPLQSVESVKYYDTAGELQTLAASDYVVTSDEAPGCIAPACGKTWLAVYDQPGSVIVEFTAGYGDAADVPAEIRGELLRFVAYLNSNRDPLGNAGGTLGALDAGLALAERVFGKFHHGYEWPS